MFVRDLTFELGNTYYIRNMQDYEAKMFFVQGRLMNQDDIDFYNGGGTSRDNSPSKPRNMYSDEIGMSGGQRRKSVSRVMGSSSPQKRIGGTSRPIPSTSTARHR